VNGSYSTLDVPDAISTYAYGINDCGQIVGQYVDADNNFHGFLRDVDGSYSTLDVPGAISPMPMGLTTLGRLWEVTLAPMARGPASSPRLNER
jgi:hypothetical protein